MVVGEHTLLKKARFSSANSSPGSFRSGLPVVPFSVSRSATTNPCLDDELELKSFRKNPPARYTRMEAAKSQAGNAGDTRFSNAIWIMLQASASRPAAKQLRSGLHSGKTSCLLAVPATDAISCRTLMHGSASSTVLHIL